MRKINLGNCIIMEKKMVEYCLFVVGLYNGIPVHSLRHQPHHHRRRRCHCIKCVKVTFEPLFGCALKWIMRFESMTVSSWIAALAYHLWNFSRMSFNAFSLFIFLVCLCSSSSQFFSFFFWNGSLVKTVAASSDRFLTLQ